MEFKLYDNGLTVHDFLLLRESVDWGVLSTLQVEQALKNGLYSVVAKHDGQTVGMGRLVGDGMMYWYIQDVIVMPQYQGKNIGKMILEKLLEHIEANSLPDTTITVGLMAAKGKEEFYKKFGFIERPTEVYGSGMFQKIKIR